METGYNWEVSTVH